MVQPVNFVTGLPFGKGLIGRARPFETSEDMSAYASALQSCTMPLTITNTADCVDERQTIALGDGTTDPEMLMNRVVAQQPGGLGLAVTKAAVGADLAIIKDAKTFKDAYMIINGILIKLEYEDAGHAKCGASTLVEKSVADEVETEALLGTLPALTLVTHDTPRLLAVNQETKRRRLADGFYGGWSNTWHEQFLMDQVPHNFSILADDPNDHETHGHHGWGALVINTPGYGFAKNRFIATTGQEAFATTVATAEDLTTKLIAQIGGSQEERFRLRLEFGVDAPQVFNQLVVEGFPVFAEAA